MHASSGVKRGIPKPRLTGRDLRSAWGIVPWTDFHSIRGCIVLGIGLLVKPAIGKARARVRWQY